MFIIEYTKPTNGNWWIKFTENNKILGAANKKEAYKFSLIGARALIYNLNKESIFKKRNLTIYFIKEI